MTPHGKLQRLLMLIFLAALIVSAMATGLGLRRAAHWGDAVVVLWAVIVTHWTLHAHWGGRLARRWSVAVLGVIVVALAVGVRSGQPFGEFYYTTNAGPSLFGTLPIVVPFLWYVLLSNLLLLARRFLPSVGMRMEAAAVALALVVLDWLLESYANWEQVYWLWRGGHVPTQNYIAWAAIAYLLVRLMAPTSSLRRDKGTKAPLILLGSATAFLLLWKVVGHIG